MVIYIGRDPEDIHNDNMDEYFMEVDIEKDQEDELKDNKEKYFVEVYTEKDQKDKLDLIDYMKKLEKTNPAMVQRVKSGMFDT